MRKSTLLAVAVALASCTQVARSSYAPDLYWQDDWSGPLGIQVAPNAVTGESEMNLAGIPLYVSGVNCYNLFVQCHEADGMRTDLMERTVERLDQEEVPIVRFSCSPFYAHQMHFYTEQKELYLANLERLATLCDENRILLVPSFFWESHCIPDFVGEPLEAIGQTDSKTFALMEEFTKDVVGALKDHKCVAAWEFGNEVNLQADIWNVGHPKLTMEQLATAMKAFARIVRELDPSDRLVLSGHGITRDAQWNLANRNSWDKDSYSQFEEVVGMMTPDPVGGVSEHIYEDVREFSDLGPLTKNQYIAAAKKAAAANGKVFYVGEFTGGACGDSLLVRSAYESMVLVRVQLSFQWNYALEGDVEDSFSADSETGRMAFRQMRFYKRHFSRMNLSPEEAARGNALRLASIFTDHAVLQRESVVPVWGWAKPGTRVKVFTSWDKASHFARTDKEGRWRLEVRTPAAGGPFSMTVSGQGESIELRDILSGEVWLCSGQSNMGLSVAGFGAQNPEGAMDDVLGAKEYASRVRVYNIRDRKRFSPQDTLHTSWSLTDPLTTSQTTAIGYKFGKRLTRLLGVPVGIIDNSWGGSLIEPWLTEECYRDKVRPQIPAASYLWHVSQRDKLTNDPCQIGTMFNTRMNPIKGYGLRGFLWYQGCGNRGGYGFYDKIQKEMVALWREAWGDSEDKLPFYFTTIAPFYYSDARSPLNGYFVENQLSSLDLIPNSGAAVTTTLGEEGNIHPAKKQEIADQFVLMAAADVYGIDTGLGSGFPRPSEVVFPSGSSVEEGTVHQSGFDIVVRKGASSAKSVKVYFANAPLGMMDHSELKVPVLGFEVAGPDRRFRPVSATCLNACVELDCSAVPDPVAVRYAFRNFIPADLESSMGIPCPSFRTDSWPLE